MRVSLTAIRGNPEVAQLVVGHGEYLFGRDPECHVRIGVDNKQGVSRRHCLLTVTEQGAFVQDLRSRNGTVVNSKRITDKQVLRDGDRLKLAGIVFLVRTYGTGYSEMADGADPCDTADILCRAVRPFPDETVNLPVDRTQG
jgi:pSer/pThr/pTyr-binding forkhead associated (FHA) protein